MAKGAELSFLRRSHACQLAGVSCLPRCQYTLTPKSWQTKTPCCHTRETVGKGVWWKVTEKQKREKKKAWCAACWGALARGNIQVLVVLVTGWAISQWIQYGLSWVEQLWAEHLGWRTADELLGSLWVLTRAAACPPCRGSVLLCHRALVGPAGMAGLVPLATSLPPPLLPPLWSLLSLCLNINFPPKFFPSKDLEP